jgi:hypothetical protein
VVSKYNRLIREIISREYIMSDVREVNQGIFFSALGGIFVISVLVLFYALEMPDFFILIFLPLSLSMLIPGFVLLYKGFPLKYRGLLLLISFVLSIVPSLITIATLKKDFFIMFHTYVMVFLMFIFIVPAIFHIYLERFKEDIPKVKRYLSYILSYASMVGLAFLVSLSLFGLGFAPQDYIKREFWVIISVGCLIGAMGTGVIIFYLFISRSGTLGTFLTQLLTTVLGMGVAAVAVILSVFIILT